MSSDPVRLRDGLADDLMDLREALREATALGPDASWRARMSENVSEAADRAARTELRDPPDSRDPADAEEPSPFEPDDAPHRLDATIAEASVAPRTYEALEAEAAGDLAAGFLAAGAALVWLVRRVPAALSDDGDERS